MLEYTTTGGMERFIGAYRKALTSLVERSPDEVGWPAYELPAVLARMERAFREGSFNHDSTGIRMACRALGIKTTRKAILEFMKGPG